MSISDRIRVQERRVLSDHYGTLTSTKFECPVRLSSAARRQASSTP